MKPDIFAEIRASQNKIKQELKYLLNQRERNQRAAIDKDKARSDTFNEELFYRQQHK